MYEKRESVFKLQTSSEREGKESVAEEIQTPETPFRKCLGKKKTRKNKYIKKYEDDVEGIRDKETQRERGNMKDGNR